MFGNGFHDRFGAAFFHGVFIRVRVVLSAFGILTPCRWASSSVYHSHRVNDDDDDGNDDGNGNGNGKGNKNKNTNNNHNNNNDHLELVMVRLQQYADTLGDYGFHAHLTGKTFSFYGILFPTSFSYPAL